jgi:tRNA/rRNA methyltransferase
MPIPRSEIRIPEPEFRPPPVDCPPLSTEPLSIVLVRPQKASNLGSVARVACNFGIGRLAVVEPAVAPDGESRRLAAGADALLSSIEHHASLEEALAGFEIVVATSSLRGRSRARPLELADLPGFLSQGAGARVAFVFGPEASGLTEDELSRASACLRLPTEPGFPTLNLSHAVAICLAVARGFTPRPARPSPERLAASGEIEAAIAHWDSALEAIDFYDTGHRGRSLRDWRSLVAARPLTVREVAILRGVANRILVSLRRLEVET